LFNYFAFVLCFAVSLLSYRVLHPLIGHPRLELTKIPRLEWLEFQLKVLIDISVDNVHFNAKTIHGQTIPVEKTTVAKIYCFATKLGLS
jgi:hypothetical protein